MAMGIHLCPPISRGHSRGQNYRRTKYGTVKSNGEVRILESCQTCKVIPLPTGPYKIRSSMFYESIGRLPQVWPYDR